ncbi:hypothetical protein M9Y10_016050 [Tritrichomonas musculus]|uniref:Uncharacterized protein n=1 Tax=Tritrichomonas musculus TaxID=1915356 RepID=A0ABR2I579_9EUKA
MTSTFETLFKKWQDGDKTIDLSLYEFTNEEIDEIFKHHDCVVVRYPENKRYDECMTIYRNSNPDRWMRVRIDDFLRDPNKMFVKDTYTMMKHGKYTPKKKSIDPKEQQRLDYEQKLRESMKAEDCELISKYVNSKKTVLYIYDGFEYQTTPARWNGGYRSHKSKCPRYTQNYIKKMFEDEGCELISEYKNQKSKLKYRYDGVVYEVVFNDWKFFNSRPHLGRRVSHHDVL